MNDGTTRCAHGHEAFLRDVDPDAAPGKEAGWKQQSIGYIIRPGEEAIPCPKCEAEQRIPHALGTPMAFKPGTPPEPPAPSSARGTGDPSPSAGAP
jgi:hypothetical protein